MIRTDRVIIVEGKYDKIKLANIIDGTIITTNGFSVFKDEEKKRLIKDMAKKRGIVVVTDSDSAGMMIRNYIKNICQDADIKNVYIPQIKGKEKRKEKAGAQNLLGVEGVSDSVIISAFQKAGLSVSDKKENKEPITKNYLYTLGLSGQKDSKEQRRSLAHYLGIIENTSSSVFLDIINTFYDKNDFERRVKEWRQEADKK